MTPISVKKNATSMCWLCAFSFFALNLAIAENETTRSYAPSFRVFLAPTLERYSLAGDGFRARLPSALGLSYGVQGDLGFVKHPIDLRFSYSKTSINYSELSGVSPSSISFSRQSLGLGFLFHPLKASEKEWLAGIKLGLLYRWVQTDSQITTPNSVINPNEKSGFAFLMEAEKTFLEKVPVEGTLEIFLPSFFRESGPSSGAYSANPVFSFRLLGKYRLNNEMTLGSGISTRWESTNFNGTGARGTVNASEGYLNWTIPFEFEMRF